MKVVEEVFEKVILRSRADGGVGLLDDKKDVDKFLSVLKQISTEKTKQFAIRNADTIKEIELAMLRCKTGVEKFNAAKKLATDARNWYIVNRLDDLKLTICWPCIDVGATKATNHCTKAPFSVHAKSGRVAVPVLRLFPDEKLDKRLHPSKKQRTIEQTIPPVVDAAKLVVGDVNTVEIFNVAVAFLENVIASMKNPESGEDIEDM
jgi:DNA primase catalytic subunit